MRAEQGRLHAAGRNFERLGEQAAQAEGNHADHGQNVEDFPHPATPETGSGGTDFGLDFGTVIIDCGGLVAFADFFAGFEELAERFLLGIAEDIVIGVEDMADLREAVAQVFPLFPFFIPVEHYFDLLLSVDFNTSTKASCGM